MNHTIKGIIIVVAITSMLVLGATMIPIMQNSFAHKKSDFKKERDPNTNTNTNTNSADSSSSSDATAGNTNNINNTATATQSQEQSACAVAITCPEGSTTVTTPPTPPTATCVPSTVGGQPATLTDGTCTAFLPGGSPQVAAFLEQCRAIPGFNLSAEGTTGLTCTFPSTPPT
jgi:Sec-independent protein translocase protein TatA